MDSIFLVILYVVLLLPFVVMSLIMLLKSSTRKKEDKQALQALIDQVKSSAPDDRKAIAEFLISKIGMEEVDVTDDAVDKIYAARKGVLQKVITAIVTRDKKYIENLNIDLDPLVNTYQTMEFQTSAEAQGNEQPLADVDTTEFEATIERLKKENKNLKIEVHTTLATLNAIFTEYASIFGDVKDQKDMSVDEILSAMESFGQSEIEQASETDSAADDLLLDEDEASAVPERAVQQATESESSADDEPGWDEALQQQAAELAPSADDEPSWDEALQQQATESEPPADDEPSWDEALQQQAVVNNESDSWGDEGTDEDLEGIADMDEIQPEWGNAMDEDPPQEPDNKK